MARPTRTGAERYFAKLAEQPAFDEARRRIDQIDRLVLDLDERREALGMTKAELARRAGIAPEAVRRLFSADSPNPTIGTLTALADSLGLELVARERNRRRTTAEQRSTISADSRTGDRVAVNRNF